MERVGRSYDIRLVTTKTGHWKTLHSRRLRKGWAPPLRSNCARHLSPVPLRKAATSTSLTAWTSGHCYGHRYFFGHPRKFNGWYKFDPGNGWRCLDTRSRTLGTFQLEVATTDSKGTFWFTSCSTQATIWAPLAKTASMTPVASAKVVRTMLSNVPKIFSVPLLALIQEPVDSLGLDVGEGRYRKYYESRRRIGASRPGNGGLSVRAQKPIEGSKSSWKSAPPDCSASSEPYSFPARRHVLVSRDQATGVSPTASAMGSIAGRRVTTPKHIEEAWSRRQRVGLLAVASLATNDVYLLHHLRKQVSTSSFANVIKGCAEPHTLHER